MISRRVFVAGPCFALAAAGLTTRARAIDVGDERQGWSGFPQQPPGLVREFVGACHRDIDRVAALLGEHPALAKCSHDWGYGDWESGLGAAAHTGRREIALLLIRHGARPDIFAAAMLGMTDVVKAMIAASPGIETTPGPHGIMLLAHAVAGEHQPTIDYVRSMPGATAVAPDRPTDEALAPFLGEYAGGDGLKISVIKNRFGLAAKAGSASEHRLVPVSPNQFHPAGAPNVRVTFTLVDGVATRLEVVEGNWYVAASRA